MVTAGNAFTLSFESRWKMFEHLIPIWTFSYPNVIWVLILNVFPFSTFKVCCKLLKTANKSDDSVSCHVKGAPWLKKHFLAPHVEV